MATWIGIVLNELAWPGISLNVYEIQALMIQGFFFVIVIKTLLVPRLYLFHFLLIQVTPDIRINVQVSHADLTRPQLEQCRNPVSSRFHFVRARVRELMSCDP